MKYKLSIISACYNEAGNVEELAERIDKVMSAEKDYEYELIFSDNDSTDGTQEVIRKIAKNNSNVKAVFNNRNYGPRRSPKNAAKHATGDAVLFIASDLQDPPELIPQFLREWENGYKLVYGQKATSDEGIIKHGLRSLFYEIINLFSDYKQYKHISGISLHDSVVLSEMLEADEDMEFRFMIAEMGYPVKLITYRQNKRKSGKSSYNARKYFAFAMESMISTTTAPLRVATVFGLVIAFVCFLIAIGYLIYKLKYWNEFVVGTAPLVIGIFFLGAVQLVFIGLVGEYVGTILKKVTKKMPVIEKELINFKEEKKDDTTKDF